MIKSLSGFINEIKIYIVCESGYMTVDDIIQTMIDKKMISIGSYGIEEVSTTKIFKDLGEYLFNYPDEVALAYILKYMFGYKNSELYSKQLYMEDWISCENVNIRKVDQVYMNLKRRVFVQPKYTKETFKFISDIVCNDKIKDIIKETSIASMTVEDFRMFHFECSMNNRTKTLEKIDCIKSILQELRPDCRFIDTSYFPWNLLKKLNSTNSTTTNSYQMLMDYLAANGLDLDDIDKNIRVANNVIIYNIKAFINDKARSTVIIEAFVSGRNLSDIKIEKKYESNKDVSTTRLHQLYSSGLVKIHNGMVSNNRFLLDGFELFVKKNSPDEIALAILNNKHKEIPAEFLSAIIPNSTMMTLQEMVAAVYNNPVLYNALLHGFIGGLILSNYELKTLTGTDPAPDLPDDVMDMNLSNRAKFALWRAGVNKTSDLITLSYDTLCKIRNVGPKTLCEINKTLKFYGIYLKGENTNAIH